MLQQTLVATVQRYYDHFLERFPTIGDLAHARPADVLHAWQGLGYYRRAQNLHRAARQCMEEHGGKLPSSADILATLPGLGRYTANAIACFAFDRKLPIIEANTRRLWTRVCAADGSPTRAPLQGELWHLAERILPPSGYRDFNQAAMDIGSRICTPRQPKCTVCPLRRFCQASITGAVDAYPRQSARAKVVDVDHVSVVIWEHLGTSEIGRVFVRRLPEGGRWAGLWEFPRAQRSPKETWKSAATRAVKESFDATFQLGKPLLTIRHGVMQERIQLRCFEGWTIGQSDRKSSSTRKWVRLRDLARLPFSSPQRRLVEWLLLHRNTGSEVRR